MRALLVLVFVVLLVVAAANAWLTDRIERRAAVALSGAVAQRTGRPPQQATVELRGWPAAMRLLAGPAPHATAVIEGMAIPDTTARLSRLRVDLDDVHADVGAALAAPKEPSFTSGGGRFTATLREADLNAIVELPPLIRRLEVDPGVVKAELPRDPVAVRAALPPDVLAQLTPEEIAGLPGELGVTGAIAAAGGSRGDALVLRPQVPGTLPRPLASLLEQTSLPVPLDILPDGVRLVAVRLRDERIVGVGTVDQSALDGRAARRDAG